MKRKVAALCLALVLTLAGSLPAAAADEPAAAAAARLYRSTLSGITVPENAARPVVFFDVCGDALPEMIVLAWVRSTPTLQIWTVRDGRAVKVLERSWVVASAAQYYLFQSDKGRVAELYTNSGSSPDSVLRNRKGRWFVQGNTGDMEVSEEYDYWYRDFRDGTHAFGWAEMNGGSASEAEVLALDRTLTTGGVLLMDLAGNGYQGRSRSDALSTLYRITGAFFDVAAGQFFAQPVEWAVEQGITRGTGTYTFSPASPCTRGEAVTFLWRAAGSPSAAGKAEFSDVKAGKFYADAVAWAVEKGVANGMGDGRFSPDVPCTRGHIVTFLWRANGSPAPKSRAGFSDVPTGQFYTDAVAWAVENGITNGKGDGKFSPNAPCTRGEIVTFLYRARGQTPEPEQSWSDGYRQFVLQHQFLLDKDRDYSIEAGFFPVALVDLDRDGTPELLLGNGHDGRALRAAYCYTYAQGKVAYLGIAPTEAYYDPQDRVGLYGRYSDSATEYWTRYTKEGSSLQTASAGEYPAWTGHPELALLPWSNTDAVQELGWEAFVASQQVE